MDTETTRQQARPAMNPGERGEFSRHCLDEPEAYELSEVAS
jgi:hypothetical protein